MRRSYHHDVTWVFVVVPQLNGYKEYAMLSVQRGASVLSAAAAYGVPHHHMRRLVKEGLVVPRALGRRSIVLFSELEAALKTLPPTKRPNRRIAA